MFVYIFFKQKRGRMSSGNQRGKKCVLTAEDSEEMMKYTAGLKKKMLQIKFCVKTQKVEHNCVWKQAL
jgi:hypothetical protein